MLLVAAKEVDKSKVHSSWSSRCSSSSLIVASIESSAQSWSLEEGMGETGMGKTGNQMVEWSYFRTLTVIQCLDALELSQLVETERQ